MSIPSEEYNAICRTMRKLESLLNGKCHRITKDDARRLLRHFPGPIRLWMIFENGAKGQVSRLERDFWSKR